MLSMPVRGGSGGLLSSLGSALRMAHHKGHQHVAVVGGEPLRGNGQTRHQYVCRDHLSVQLQFEKLTRRTGRLGDRDNVNILQGKNKSSTRHIKS